ncbi:MAG: 2-C-methyl-D-erythritol 2,4-cyclodiphosphate synthase [Candidatus Eisenbacteria bacterium]
MPDDYRVGQGSDLHRLVPGRRLVLGGVEIPHERGLAGHSDADAIVHAIIDALLGAAGDGDIGTHFPDRDPAWKDAHSLELLESTARRLADLGWVVVNVDATVIAEAPRIGPFRERMRAAIAGRIGLSPAAVSIKGKTAEGLGPEGRGEAISAQAIAMLRRAGPPGAGSSGR